MASKAKVEPSRARLTALLGLPEPGPGGPLLAVAPGLYAAEAIAPMAISRIRVMPRVIQLDRSDQNLPHSECSTLSAVTR